MSERRAERRSGKLGQDLGAVRQHPCLLTGEIGRVRRDREHDREPGEDALERVEARVRAGHADVDVEPAHALPPGRDPRVGDELGVPFFVGDLLLLGPAHGVTAGRGHLQSALLGKRHGPPPELGESLCGLFGRLADVGGQFERGGEELTLESPGQPGARGRRNHLVRPRREQKRIAIEHHQLLLHPH